MSELEQHRPEYTSELIDYSKFSDPRAVERLRELGIENVSLALAVEHEKDISNNEINAEILWAKFKKPTDAEWVGCTDVEGKLYLPNSKEKDNGSELILFSPGFPGGDAGRFEQRYAKTFTGAGYAFFTIRHNGTNLANPKRSPGVINCPERMAVAQALSEQHIGGERSYNQVEVVNEPITPLLSLAPKFDRIHLMGQSLGVAASYNAATRLAGHPDITEKFGNIINISGFVGKDKNDPQDDFDGMKMTINELTDYQFEHIAEAGTNTAKTHEEFKAAMKQVAQLNAKINIPEHVGNILIFTPGDPLIAGPHTSEQDYLNNYGPQTSRKLIIQDMGNLKDKKQHSMLWIAPENLLRAVQADVHGRHYIKLPNTKIVDEKQNKAALEKGT